MKTHRMSICLMNDNFYRSSGAAIAIRRISEAYSEIEYCVAGTGDRKPEDLSWVPDGLYRQFRLKTANPALLLVELYRFKRWFKLRGCDLVHCHHRRLATLLNWSGVPVLYSGHLAFPEARWFRWFHPRWMTAITPSVAANISETTGTDVLAIIGNPVHFPAAPPAVDVESVKHRAICIGRFDPVKGHKHLLRAWKILLDRGHQYHLDLVGEGDLRADLEAQTKLDGTQHLIHFCGFLDDVMPVIEKSLFSILASEVEGQGIVTLEAATAGRPSLLTAVPGSIDMLPPNRTLPNGVTFGNAEQLADAIGEWFSRPSDTVREGMLFFDFLEALSRPAEVAKAYNDVYTRLAPRRQSAARRSK